MAGEDDEMMHLRPLCHSAVSLRHIVRQQSYFSYRIEPEMCKRIIKYGKSDLFCKKMINFAGEFRQNLWKR